MENEGVMRQIDASAWTSNIVVAREKNGGVRMCVNLFFNVKKAILPQRYPSPTMEELPERIAGSTIFSKLDMA
jgi:hypothetical protein